MMMPYCIQKTGSPAGGLAFKLHSETSIGRTDSTTARGHICNTISFVTCKETVRP